MRAVSCGKPPQASTTPRRAVIRTGPAAPCTIAPVTVSPSRISASAGVSVWIGMPSEKQLLASRAASALPLVTWVPRR